MADVWSDATSNAYSTVTSTKEVDQPKEAEHTRIYMYTEPTILLDEMSMPYNDSEMDMTVDPSTGTRDAGDSDNINEQVGATKGNLTNSEELSIGFTYPLIRINDHYYTHNDILKFTLSCTEFLPKIELLISTYSNDILKQNHIKDGDKCSVFINSGHGMIKSYRGDFIITCARMFEQKQTIKNNVTTIFIEGELFIPGLYDANMTDVINATSRDALIAYADKLGLGFFFCDPDNTEDYQTWYSESDGTQRYGGDPPMVKAIKDIASHAYKNFNSFYDCWIDPRYGLTFLNINKMLGEDGLDEEIDLAFYNNILSNSRGVDAERLSRTEDETKANPYPQAKILTNVGTDAESLTSFFVISYKEINNASSISNMLGLATKDYYNISNSGLSLDENSVEMKYSIPVNKTKLENGFVLFAGPGTNETYKEGDNGSYVDLHISKQGGQIASTMSDDDANLIQASGNNMYCSGNNTRWYEVGYNHNLLNNKWLEKKMIKVVLNGCNMQVMRGEKIPMILRDNQFGVNMLGMNARNAVTKLIFENGTGWFIIHSIKWEYNINNRNSMGTQWTTTLVLTRREWPEIGYNKEDSNKEADAIIAENDLVNGSIKEAVYNTNSNDDTPDEVETASQEEISTDGLKSFMKTIYNDIKNAVKIYANGDIILVSGRRWGVDINGNRIDGPSLINDNGIYKFINANGDELWFSSNTSKHIYGEAIDIIPKGCTREQLLEAILSDFQTTYDMFENGAFLMVEQTKDDTGNTIQHYHIGTLEQNNSNQITNQMNWWNTYKQLIGSSSWKSPSGKTIIFDQYKSKNKGN